VHEMQESTAGKL